MFTGGRGGLWEIRRGVKVVRHFYVITDLPSEKNTGENHAAEDQ